MLISIPKSNVANLLAQIDIAYIGWNSNPLYRFGISPNKSMGYTMAGKPIVHPVNAGNDLVTNRLWAVGGIGRPSGGGGRHRFSGEHV